jgi:hypothetical protein
MDTIFFQIDRLLSLTKAMLAVNPADHLIKIMCDSLEELRTELSKPDASDKRVKQLMYGITRVFDNLRYLENTQFGRELGELLIALNQLY